MPPPLAKRPRGEDLVGEVYRSLRECSGHAWGTPDSPIYGENSRASMQHLVEVLGLREGSHFLDMGAGVGGPSAHVAALHPLVVAYGVEVVGTRWWLSQCYLAALLRHGSTRDLATRLVYAHADLADVASLGPITHVYAFDTGFPPRLLQHLAALFNAAPRLECVASFQRPAKLAAAGAKVLRLRTKVTMHMVSSGEGKTCYVYDVAPPPLTLPLPPWDLYTHPGPPRGARYKAPLAPSPVYTRGEEARGKGGDGYLRWATDQVGLEREENRGVRTRAARRRYG